MNWGGLRPVLRDAGHTKAKQTFQRKQASPCPTLSIPRARPVQATPHVNALENAEGKGGKKERGRVPGRTGRRSSYCGFAEVLGFSRAELSGTNIMLRECEMTPRQFLTSLLNHMPLN